MKRVKYVHHVDGDIEGMPRWTPGEVRAVSDELHDELIRTPHFRSATDESRVPVVQQVGDPYPPYEPDVISSMENALSEDAPGLEPVHRPTRRKATISEE